MNLNFLTRLCGLMVRRWRLIGYSPTLYNPQPATTHQVANGRRTRVVRGARRRLFPRASQQAARSLAHESRRQQRHRRVARHAHVHLHPLRGRPAEHVHEVQHAHQRRATAKAAPTLSHSAVCVPLGTGYNRVEGNRRASRSGPRERPPKTRPFRFGTCFAAVSPYLRSGSSHSSSGRADSACMRCAARAQSWRREASEV
jgi:hypothetical protein